MRFTTNLRKPLTAFIGSIAIAMSSLSFAGVETNTSAGGTLKGPGLAVHGFDPVAYFTAGKPVRGSAKYSAVYNDATYRFNSAAHLKEFERNPAKYAPQYGGYCAYGVAVGAKFDGDPDHWKIVNGKLYLNLNQDIQNTWSEDVPGNIEKANSAWKKIADKRPDELG